MTDHEQDEVEEHVDLDGDNDIDDTMYDEEGGDEERYRKAVNEYGEEEEQDLRDEVDDEEHYQKAMDEYAEEEHEHDGGEEEDKEHATEVENENFAPSSMNEENLDDSNAGYEDREKRQELLALPPHGSEVFIGGLPRDANEDDLQELCEPYGEIFEVKLVRDKDTKESKGFAFIGFSERDAAQKAIEEIHDKEFKGRTLRCSLSQVKHRLFIGNIPKSLTEQELRKVLDKAGPGVENIECFKDAQNPGRNRGFIFVEYYNHACADYARQKMSDANFNIDGSRPSVSWAEPKNSSESSAAAQVKVLYVKNLPENVAPDKLKELFGRHGEVTKVVLPPAKAGQSKRDFGFVHFAERSSALKALKGAEKYEIDGHVLEVTLARPQTDKKSSILNPYRSGPVSPYPSYGYPGDPYGAYGAGVGAAAAASQPMIYGRGPMPSGMKMVPMVLPDGRLGYVLQQPGGPPPLPPRRVERGSGSRNEEGRGRRYRPY